MADWSVSVGWQNDLLHRLKINYRYDMVALWHFDTFWYPPPQSANVPHLQDCARASPHSFLVSADRSAVNKPAVGFCVFFRWPLLVFWSRVIQASARAETLSKTCFLWNNSYLCKHQRMAKRFDALVGCLFLKSVMYARPSISVTY